MTAAVTGVSSPEPPDPPEPPDLTSAFTTPSTFVCVPVLTLTISDLDLKIQTFREIDWNSQIFKETFLLKRCWFGDSYCRVHTTPYCSRQICLHHLLS
uniref:Uncharacterized protein n=1 Tax=Brassica campestris TaxID=3711 RepID=A0A3P5Z371_BRACM|nr:unnamed protein product [Brassica rapa]